MKKCRCSLRTKLVGDGCEVCNPPKRAKKEDTDFGLNLGGKPHLFTGWGKSYLVRRTRRGRRFEWCCVFANSHTSPLQYTYLFSQFVAKGDWLPFKRNPFAKRAAKKR